LEAAIRDALDKPVGEEITIGELATLSKLEVDSSAIAHLSGLEYCTNLTELLFSENQVSDISPLTNLTSLTTIYLWGNQISDISPLVENAGLGAGDTVYLQENNLDLWEGSGGMANIRVLEDRGVVVDYK